MNGVDITGEIERLSGSFLAWLPKIVTVLVILVIGYIISRILKSITIAGLRKLGFDRRLYESHADNLVRRITKSPSRTVGNFVYWLGIIVTVTIAIFALEIAPLSQIVQGVYSYVPNVLGAIVILAAALVGATVVGGILLRLMGDTTTGRFLAGLVPVVILSVSTFAILEQLQIAPTIVTITYVALIGSLALGLAIALGLGGRDVAGRMLNDAYEKGRGNIDQVKNDIERGKARGEREAKNAKKRSEEK